MIKAIIFDFDGTILDTEHTELAAWQYIFEEHKSVLPLVEWRKRLSIGPQSFDPMQYLENLVGCSLDREMITKHRRNKLAALVADLQPIIGIRTWLNDAYQRGICLAVASNSPKYWVTDHLKRVELFNYFDAIITREDVNRVKPHPESYELALRKLKVSANEAIAIEDSPIGLASAFAAGIKCIVVPNKLTSILSFPHSHRLIRNLEDIKLSNILHESIATDC
jgi:HAD superfamily hydrolase (TIGR01509 family)